MQTIACIKWGALYPPDYVNRLRRAVARHVVRPTRFVLFTDDAGGLEPGVEARPIPPIALSEGLRPGPWRKLALWSRDLGLDGDVLYLDLDVVVTGGLDALFDYEPGKLCIIRNWTQKRDGVGNSSVMRFPAGGAPHLLEDFERDAVRMSFHFDNEQIYVTRECRLPTAFWPEAWCPSFKHDLLPRFPLNLWKEASLPSAARVVVFTGHPRPHEALVGRWPAPWHKKLYKTLRPVTWLKEVWA